MIARVVQDGVDLNGGGLGEGGRDVDRLFGQHGEPEFGGRDFLEGEGPSQAALSQPLNGGDEADGGHDGILGKMPLESNEILGEAEGGLIPCRSGCRQDTADKTGDGG